MLAGNGPRWREMERAMGIEPTAQAWEAWVLPLYDARRSASIARPRHLANFMHKSMDSASSVRVAGRYGPYT
jgi:chromosomal replication initiation ATPase DnaA